MITLQLLNDHFEQHPEDRAVLAASIPEFVKDECYITRKTASGITPRKSVYIDGERRIISIRSLAAYFVLGEYEMWVPLSTCQPGCINPHHQLAMGQGVHAQQPKLSQAERTAKALQAEFTAPALPLPPDGVGDMNRLDHLAASTLHDFKSVKAGHDASTDRTMAAE